MHRDLDRLTERTFDLLVVGGGIYGLTVACDAAQRGLAVALIERKDFGSGASFNHLRTIHGGLRYLQTFDIGRARESIGERRTLARIAPAAVRPLPFVLPLTRSLTKGTLAMRAGFLLDRVIARGRNEGVPESHRLPGGGVIGRAEALERFPELRGMSLTGAAIWHDYVTTDADRLTISWGLAAAGCGAVLANYVEATSLSIDGGRCIGVRAQDRGEDRGEDRARGRVIDIAARVILNATGGSLDRLLAPSQLTTGVPMMKAMNLVTRRDGPAAAIGGRGPGGRTLFMVPWKGRALFGTWESSALCAPGDTTIAEEDLTGFLSEINAAFPSIALTRADVTLIHRGVVPATLTASGSPTLAGHDRVIDHALRGDHAQQGADGLLSLSGTKYTTARAIAERVTERVFAKLGRSLVPCRTATTPLPLPDLQGDELLAHAAAAEMVVTLEDAVVRRTPLGALGEPGEGTMRRAAGVVGAALGWNDQRQRTEIEALREFYRGLTARA